MSRSVGIYDEGARSKRLTASAVRLDMKAWFRPMGASTFSGVRGDWCANS